MNNQEVFKTVKGYEGLYEISNLGNVKSLKRKDRLGRPVKEKVLKAGVNSRGYLNVVLSKNGKYKTFTVHQLVVMAFLNHTLNGMKGLICDHVDNDRLNNLLSNLQLITNRLNTSKDKNNGTSKFTGVSWRKSNNKWVSSIKINGKNKYLGYFKTEIEASKAYQKALKEHKENLLKN